MKKNKIYADRRMDNIDEPILSSGDKLNIVILIIILFFMIY